VAVDADGNTYLTGSFSDTLRFNASVALAEVGRFVARLDAGGAFEWARVIDGLQSLSDPALALDAQGHAHVAIAVNEFEGAPVLGMVLRGYRPDGSVVYTQFVEGLWQGMFSRNFFTQVGGYLYLTGYLEDASGLPGVVETVFHQEGRFVGRIPLQTLVSRTEAPPLPAAFVLEPPYPNPFHATVTIGYVLPAPAEVTLRVYDVLGREVTLVDHGYKAAGSHTVRFSAGALPAGVYLYRLRAGAQQAVRQMVRLR